MDAMEEMVLVHALTGSGGGVESYDTGDIVGDEIVGPFRVADDLKMPAKAYIDFMMEHFVR